MDSLDRLIAALRDELQQYGEMLALLEREQDLVLRRASAELLESVNSIQAQAAAIQGARAHREQCHAALAAEIGCPAGTALTELLTRLPGDYQPLVDALIRENNHLLIRVQHRARQNHLLLSRSLELMQRFIATLFPARDTQVYDGQGQRPSPTHTLHPLYDAIG